ncbi:hypothetical protein BH10PSE3_BH10PSE3_29240 [soil metagenome]
MTTHGPKELEREGRLIRAHTRASLMSDTKWRRLLTALNNPALELRQCVIKFVGDPIERTISKSFGLHLPRPWIDSFAFGPIPLRSIEWLLFPCVASYDRGDPSFPKQRVGQDVDQAASIIAGLGRYPFELSGRGLLITGHLPVMG